MSVWIEVRGWKLPTAKELEKKPTISGDEVGCNRLPRSEHQGSETNDVEGRSHPYTYVGIRFVI